MRTTTDAPGTSSPERTAVLSMADLSYGDLTEASYKGTLVHRCQVPEIAPNHELFWITDYLSGSRRLLDVAEFEVVRLANSSATEEPGI